MRSPPILESVIDFGCATGLYLKPFLEAGISAWGIDNSEIAKKISTIPKRIVMADLTKPFHTKKCDLVLCLEVAEHLDKKFEKTLLDNICYPSDAIVFSAAAVGQDGMGHVNCQPKQHWLALFAERGFALNSEQTGQLVRRLKQGTCPYWLPQNIMVLQREQQQSDSVTEKPASLDKHKPAQKEDQKIHFILTGGELVYPYYLAIISALKTQNAKEFILWAFEEPKGQYWSLLREKVKLEIVDALTFPELPDSDARLKGATIKDYLEWQILYEHGGIYLDLDTFCLGDVTYLNTGKEELVVPHEVENESPNYPFFNAAIVMAKPRSPILKEILDTATEMLSWNSLEYGIVALLVTLIAREHIDKVRAVNFGVLGGAGRSKLSTRLYNEKTELWDGVKILHLAGSAFSQFSEFTEEYIRDSDILFARVVRGTLEPREWAPFSHTPPNSPSVVTLEKETNKLHFILTSSELVYPYYLAIMSALKVQNVDQIILWAFEEPKGRYWQLLKDRIELQIISKPEFPALKNKPDHFRHAHMKDYLQWKVLYLYGGIFMDLDTFSVQDIFDLQTEDCDVVAPLNVDHIDDCPDPFHIGIVMARPHSPIMLRTMYEAGRLLLRNDIKWGDTGPKLFSAILKDKLEKVKIVERGVLGGHGEKVWGTTDIFTPGKLWSAARVVHLYFGGNLEEQTKVDENYIETSPCLYAQIVKQTLTRAEWAPTAISVTVEETAESPRDVFYSLLEKCDISCICDVGSMDGADSLLFRNLKPQAHIFAFEPNKHNFREMVNNNALIDNHIQIFNCAVCDKNGVAELRIVDKECDSPYLTQDRKGMSSLYARGDVEISETIQVRTTRIDDFLLPYTDITNIALWIDVEGGGYQVLKGIDRIKDRISIVHIEVENKEIWRGQKLYTDVLGLMTEYGFTMVVNSSSSTKNGQGNAVFVRQDLQAPFVARNNNLSSDEAKVHFVCTGPSFPYSYYIGIMTAWKAYGDAVVLWFVHDLSGNKYIELLKDRVNIKQVPTVPKFPALSGCGDYFFYMATFDYLIWNIVYKHGGMIMGLDSITLKPHFDLLEPDKQLMAPINNNKVQPYWYSMHGAIVRKGSAIAKAIITDAESALGGSPDAIRWGDVGITPFNTHVRKEIDKVSTAPFGSIGGRLNHGGEDFYLLKQDGQLLTDDVRTIPLYSSSTKLGEKLTSSFVRNNDTLYSRLVKRLLTEEEWNPL